MVAASERSAKVLLVCMPFGPVFSPSLGLSLLKAGLAELSIQSRVLYFSIAFAERIGQDFYSGVSTYGRPPHRHLAGEWIFAEALFGRDSNRDEGYVEEVLLRRDGDSSDRPVSPAMLRRLWRARGEVDSFLDWCLERIVERRPRIVGFTSVFHQHLASLALARRLKEALPDCFVVMGGANCEGAMGAETVRQFPFVDAAVSGEGDVVFPELVVRVLEGRPVDGLAGVRTRATVDAELATRRISNAPSVQFMDSLPRPDYGDYFEQFRESRYPREWQPSVFFETSRGCWWGERMHCTFCGLNGSTMAYRSKSAERALAELADLSGRHPGCDVQVVDNILDLAYFKDFLPALAARKLGIDLFYETKSNLKKEQVRALRRAGITRIQPGIESLSDAILKLMRKGVSALQNIQLLKWCKELGVEPYWNVIWGFPGEAADEYQRMAERIPLLTHLTPPRGFGRIRLDRFSPNFEDADRLGFTEVTPLLPYRFVYPLSEEARSNLSYFFSFDYREQRDVSSYVSGLAYRLRAWKKTRGTSELLSIPTRDSSILLDTRPAARAPFHVLNGIDRVLYEACDAIATLPELAARVERAGMTGVAESELAARLEAMSRQGLLLRDGGRHLALAVPFGEYQPSPNASRRLHAILERAGRRTAGSLVVSPNSTSRPVAASKSRLSRSRRAACIEPARFSLNDVGELIVRI